MLPSYAFRRHSDIGIRGLVKLQEREIDVISSLLELVRERTPYPFGRLAILGIHVSSTRSEGLGQV